MERRLEKFRADKILKRKAFFEEYGLSSNLYPCFES